MFNVKKVLNEKNGQLYFIRSASLVNEEGPDYADDGANWYTVDLEPYGADGHPISGLDLVVYGDGVSITRNLNAQHKDEPDPARPGHIVACTVPAKLNGDMLIVPWEE